MVANMNKKAIIAFIGICFAWSFSWYAIKYQSQSEVSVYLSISYRFFTAFILCWLYLKIFKYEVKIPRKAVKYTLISGFANASLNFIIIYYAVRYITSGIVTAIFSLSIIFSEIVNSIFYKTQLNKKTIISGLIGTIGLTLFLLPTMNIVENKNDFIYGVMLSFIPPIIVPIGIVAMQASTKKYSIPTMTYMLYTFLFGAVISFTIAMISGDRIIFDTSLPYIISFVYSVLIASLIAYSSLFYLAQTIGAARASFTSLVYTIGAMLVSTYFEDYNWGFVNLIGFMLVILSIFTEFKRKI